MESAGGAAGADGDGDGFDQAGADEAGGWAGEVVDRVGGLERFDALLVAQGEERVGELGALRGCVDLRGDGGERVPAPVGIVVRDRFTESLQVWTDQFGQRDVERKINGGEVEEAFTEPVERVLWEADQVLGGVVREGGEVGSGELFFGGAALLAAAAFDFAARAAGAGLVASGSGHCFLLSIALWQGRIRAGQITRFCPG